MSDDGGKPEGQDEGEAGRIKSLDERFAAIEDTQAEQGGKLDQILSKLGGLGGGGTEVPKGGSAGPTGGDTGSGGDLGSAVQAELAKIKAAEEAEAKARGDADWRAGVDAKLALVPERQPREPQKGPKGGLQKFFGTGDHDRAGRK
jgi:hypothetical protein